MFHRLEMIVRIIDNSDTFNPYLVKEQKKHHKYLFSNFSHKLLGVKEIVNNDKIIWTIELGAVIVRQGQFEILVGLIQDVSTKVDVGLKEVNIKVDEGFKEVRTDIKEIKKILKKHDDLFVEHQWLKQTSF